MSGLLRVLGRIGPEARVGLVATLILALSIVGSAVTSDGDPAPVGAHAQLGNAQGKVVVDPDGRPVRGPDGKPLRVAKDGRTLIDSKGRVLRDASGTPLRIRPGAKLPAAVRRAIRRRPDRGSRDRGRRRDRRRPRPAATPAPDAPPVRLAALFTPREKAVTGGRAFGISHDPGDPEAQLKALVAHVNATGGIAGRRLKISAVSEDHSDPTGFEAEADDQARRLLDGPRPLAVVAPYGRPALLVPRLAAAGVPLMSDWSWSQPSRFMKQWGGHYFALSGVPLNLIADPYVAGLQRAGFFRRGSNVGVLTWDGEWWKDGNVALDRALSRAGVKPAAEARIWADGSDQATLARVAADISSAVVKFQLAGVERIVGLDQGGLATLIFMLAAEQRKADFVYGLNSTHHPATLAVQDNRRSQLDGAVGIGWSPVLDVPTSEEPRSQMRATCRRIYDAANAHVGDRSWFGEYNALAYCEQVLAIREAIELSGSATPEGLRQGLEMLGSRFDSPLNLATRFGPGRHYGTAAARPLRYDESCTCFRYEGELHEIG